MNDPVRRPGFELQNYRHCNKQHMLILPPAQLWALMYSIAHRKIKIIQPKWNLLINNHDMKICMTPRNISLLHCNSRKLEEDQFVKSLKQVEDHQGTHLDADGDGKEPCMLRTLSLF